MKIKDIRLPFSKILTVGLLPSPLKKLYYRLKGYKFGSRVTLGWGSVLAVSGSCEIGEGTRIGNFSIFSAENLRIGKRCKIRSFTIFIVPRIVIGTDVVISETSIIRAQHPFPDSSITIGDRVHIFPFSIIDPSRPVDIGPETSVGFSTYIFTHGVYKDKLAGYPVTHGEVKLGKSVWLPCRIFIMPGITLGDDVVVGTGSVVTQSFQDGALVLGQPAKLVKNKEEFVVDYTPEQQLAMLKEILQEFKIYLEHFYQAKTEMLDETRLSIEQGSRRVTVILLEALGSSLHPEPGQIYIVYKKIDPDIQKIMDQQKVTWFSYEGHQCSARLDGVGEVLREFFTRYGVLFERP